MNPGITNFILIRLKINFITRTPSFNLTVVGEQKESDIRDQRSQKPLGDEYHFDHINKLISTLAPHILLLTVVEEQKEPDIRD